MGLTTHEVHDVCRTCVYTLTVLVPILVKACSSCEAAQQDVVIESFCLSLMFGRVMVSLKGQLIYFLRI